MLENYNPIEILRFAIQGLGSLLGVRSGDELVRTVSRYMTFSVLHRHTFVSFTGIAQLLEATTDLFWRPSLAGNFVYIIGHESIPHRKTPSLLGS